MKTKILGLCLLFMASFFIANAQYNFVVQNQSATVYTSLQMAYDSATVGDTIYIPGGSFNMPTTISKSLTWIGVGYHPDSTKATYYTKIGNSVTFSGDADLTNLLGIHFSTNLVFGSALNPVMNLTINRCYLGGNITLKYNDNGENVETPIHAKISECIFEGSISGYSASQVTIQNSIVKGVISDLYNSYINHCLITNGTYSNYQSYDRNISGLNNCLIKNNVFYYNSSATRYKIHCTNCSFKNNIFAASPSFPYETNTGIDNIVGIDVNTLFVHLEDDNLRNFNYLNDYHLAEGSIAIGAGTNGVDIGLYGGSNSFKVGGLPNIPHIRSIKVADETTNGKLPVEIEVIGQ